MRRVLIGTDGKMLLYSHHGRVTHVGDPILAFLAVMNEQFARIQVNVIQT
jgi:hypothetical protein